MKERSGVPLLLDGQDSNVNVVNIRHPCCPASGGATMSNVVATRFSDEVLAELDAVARELHRSRAEVVRRAVQIFLDEYADHQIALERLNEPRDPQLTSEQTWTELGWGERGPEH
jgi:RHH-type transcriptional regulator, rel operon repressor / antitoxin RelB